MIPESYTFSDSQSANGSSVTGHCSSTTNTTAGTITCTDPTSGVLFDGHIPTLTNLDGHTWARQLLVLRPRNDTTRITFDFCDSAGYDGVLGMEVSMFNCPEWGMQVKTIQFLEGASQASGLGFVDLVNPNVTSCGSLVTVRLGGASRLPYLGLEFVLGEGSEWVLLAEVNFDPFPGTTTATTAAVPAVLGTMCE